MIGRSMIRKVLFCLALTALAAGGLANPASLSLAGRWRFAIDKRDEGVRNAWFKSRLADQITLPGTTDAQGKGEKNTRIETNDWSRLYNCPQIAWYQREVAIPQDWAGKRITLTLGRTKLTQLWVDDKPAGTQDGVCAAQIYDLSGLLTPGQHMLTLRVALGPFPNGIGGHHLGGIQGNWNGIIGRLDLTATDPVWIEEIKVRPDVAAKKAKVRITIGNRRGRPARGILTLAAESWNTEKSHKAAPLEVSFNADSNSTGSLEVDYPLGEGAQPWDEFHSALYRLSVGLKTNGPDTFSDRQQTDFGLREFKRAGTQFSINGKTIMLRGSHDACHFPLTGAPPMDDEGWLRFFKVGKSYGINHYRFHTWCPPEAAFAAADRLGLYLQPELPSQGGFAFGENREHDDYCRLEGERILRQMGNHPSFVMFSLGNEIGIKRPENRQAMTALINDFRQVDFGGRLFAEGSNNCFWNPTLNPNDDYWTTTYVRVDRHGKIIVRGSSAKVDGWLGHIDNDPPSTMKDYRREIADVPVPVIGHEIGQYCVFPNFKEAEKYTGVFRLRNYDVFKERLREKGMLDQADDFVRASGALATLCYREEIEAYLRTPGFGGFQMLDLADDQEQGTSLVGILDSFMDSKGFITPEAWREFCCEVVPLARMEKRTWRADEPFSARVEVANYGPAAFPAAEIAWTLADEQGRKMATGELAPQAIPQGKLSGLGEIRCTLDGVKAPAKLTLALAFKGTQYANHYPVWVYPARVTTAAPAGVTVSRKLDRATLDALAGGGRVVLFPEPKAVEKNSVEGAFMTDFWNSVMFKKQPGTYGILCDPGHPALATFPTDFHSDWQWWSIVKTARPIILDATPKDYRPLVQEVDTFARNHKLGLIFEARVGKGCLLVCASDLPAMQEKPEARQLMASLLAYAGSEWFSPKSELEMATLKKILCAE